MNSIIKLRTKVVSATSFLLLSCFFIICGCESTQRFYTGKTKSRVDVAIVKVTPTGLGSLVSDPGFFKVDGSGKLPSGKGLDRNKSIELLPGSHDLQVRWVWKLGEGRAYPMGPDVVKLLGGEASLRFDAESGHEYTITWLEEEPWKVVNVGFTIRNKVIVPLWEFTGRSFIVLEDITAKKSITRAECIPDSRQWTGPE
jgi:hypothetical protein